MLNGGGLRVVGFWRVDKEGKVALLLGKWGGGRM